MGFSKQEYWSGLPFPSTGDLPSLASLASPAVQADSFTSEPLASFIFYLILFYITFLVTVCHTDFTAHYL